MPLRGSFCVSFGCSNSWSNCPKKKFHGFPLKKPELLRAWVQATKRIKFNATASSKLCSDHFLDSDYTGSPRDSRLRPGAVPSIFDFSDHLKKKQPKVREGSKKRALFCTSTDLPSTSECHSEQDANDHSYFEDKDSSITKLKSRNENLQKKIMVTYCCACNCTNTKTKYPNKSFHRFPRRNPELLQKWIAALRRENFKPTKYTALCSDHFLLEDFQIRPGAERPFLTTTAVPSVFDFTPQLDEMPSCWAVGCRSNDKSQNVRLLRFPHDKEKRRLWSVRVGRCDATGKLLIAKDSTRLCTLHFEPSQFHPPNGSAAPKLKSLAEPTLFPRLTFLKPAVSLMDHSYISAIHPPAAKLLRADTQPQVSCKTGIRTSGRKSNRRRKIVSTEFESEQDEVYREASSTTPLSTVVTAASTATSSELDNEIKRVKRKADSTEFESAPDEECSEASSTTPRMTAVFTSTSSEVIDENGEPILTNGTESAKDVEIRRLRSNVTSLQKQNKELIDKLEKMKSRGDYLYTPDQMGASALLLSLKKAQNLVSEPWPSLN